MGTDPGATPDTKQISEGGNPQCFPWFVLEGVGLAEPVRSGAQGCPGGRFGEAQQVLRKPEKDVED